MRRENLICATSVILSGAYRVRISSDANVILSGAFPREDLIFYHFLRITFLKT